MDSLIQSDLFRYAGNTSKSSFFRCLRIPGFRYSFFLRKSAQTSKYSPIGVIYRLFYYKYCFKYGFQIPYHTHIGKGLQISHFGPVVINSKAIIGDNCYLSHNVTIGQANRGKNKGYPTIGNKVWIGAGAAVIGGIMIGENVLIAPNAYVNFDVPANSIVIGNPAKIIPNIKATEDYIVNVV
ncbi:serine acetyltransferase [Fibrella sp. ES10-3-2-2]